MDSSSPKIEYVNFGEKEESGFGCGVEDWMREIVKASVEFVDQSLVSAMLNKSVFFC